MATRRRTGSGEVADDNLLDLGADGDATPELARTLREAQRFAQRAAQRCRLSTQDPETRRYVWFGVAAVFGRAAQAIEEEVERLGDGGTGSG